MKAKHKIGEVFNCCGHIIVIVDVTTTSYSTREHLYRFKFLDRGIKNKLDPVPFYMQYDDTDLAKFKRIKL